MKTFLKILSLMVLVWFFTACLPTSPESNKQAAPVAAEPVTPSPSIDPEVEVPAVPLAPAAPIVLVPPAPPVNPTVSLTYYSLSETRSPVNGWILKQITYTGSCAVYLAKTYCWDDGIKTIPAWTFNHFTYGPYTYAYWGLKTLGSGYSICDGGCGNLDFMLTPKFMFNGLTATVTAAKINEVFTTGAAHQVDCSETATQLNCGDFVIDLN